MAKSRRRPKCNGCNKVLNFNDIGKLSKKRKKVPCKRGGCSYINEVYINNTGRMVVA